MSPPGGTAAVILNHNTPEASIRAARSLMRSRTSPAAIIVVDNGSADDSVHRISQAEPTVQVIEAGANRGFPGGCNLGIRAALDRGAGAVLLLNSDAVVAPETLETLERVLASDPAVGIVGPMIVSLDDPGAVQSLGIRYSVRTGRMRHHGHGVRAGRVRRVVRTDVDGVSGCAMLIRREVPERIGLLAEEYFFGFEDLDFCLRAGAAGFRCACAATAAVLHEGSLSMGRSSPRRMYFAVRNHLLLAERMRPHTGAPSRWLRSAAIVGLNVAHALVQRDVPRGSGLRAVARGVADFKAGRFGPDRLTLPA